MDDTFYFQSKNMQNQAKGNEMASHYHKLHLLSEGIPIFVLKIYFSLTDFSVASINWKANETS